MTTRAEPNKWASLDFPAEFRVGLKRFAQDCGWMVRDRRDAIQVATRERYTETRPQLLRLVKVADCRSATTSDGYSRFDRWPPQDNYGGVDLREQVMRLREVTSPERAVDAWVSFRLQFMTVPDAQVSYYLRDLFSQLCESAPEASLWAIEIDPQFRWRVAAVRALFAAREAPEVLGRALQPGSEQTLRFFSSQGLADSWSYGLGVFTEPLLLAGSPWIAGLSSYRVGGTAVMLFGTPQAGFTDRQAAEGLDIFRTSGFVRSRAPTSLNRLDARAYEVALLWWIDRLNDLAGIALDVGRYVDASGTYQPAANLGVLFSLERLFASVQTILAQGRGSELVRLLLLFDVVDLFDGLSFGSWESMLTRPRVERDLARLEQLLPEAAREYLLTRCRPAVEALRELEDGFALKERVVGDKIRLRQRDGKGWQDINLTTAIPQYLRVARNAQHSFRKMARDPHELSLLASHDGDIPDSVSDLAFLHLLRFLADPHLPSS